MKIPQNNSFITKGLSVLFWPTLQLVLVRCYLHYILGLRIGFANTTDFDFIFPAPIAFLFLIYALDAAKPLNLKLNRYGVLANLLFLLAFLLFNQSYSTLSTHSPELTAQTWFALLGGMVLSACCVLLRPNDYLRNPKRLALLPCLFIGSSLYLYQNGWRWLWLLMGSLTSATTQKIFSLMPSHFVMASFTPEEAVRLDHPALSVRIGRGCGGGDAIFFFVLTFALILILHPKRAKITQWLGGFVLGIIWMFFVNIFRIVLLFFTGIALRTYLGEDTGTEIFKWLFHTNVGWLLYVASIFAYLKMWAVATKLKTIPNTWDMRPMDQQPTGA